MIDFVNKVSTSFDDLIITDLAFIEVTSDGSLLREVAPGWTVEEVQALTEPNLIVAEDIKEIEL